MAIKIRSAGKTSLSGVDPSSRKAGQIFAVAASAYTGRVVKTQAQAIATLHREGILTPTGRLKRRYSLTKG